MTLFKQILFFGSLTISVLLLTSCGLLGGGEEAAPPPATLGSDSAEPLAGPAQVTCSQTCADQGQCGTAASMEGSPRVVFLNNTAPNLDQHDAILGSGTIVNILSNQELTVAKIINDQEQSLLRFYQVEVEGRAPAWLAGWGIQQ